MSPVLGKPVSGHTAHDRSLNCANRHTQDLPLPRSMRTRDLRTRPRPVAAVLMAFSQVYVACITRGCGRRSGAGRDRADGL